MKLRNSANYNKAIILAVMATFLTAAGAFGQSMTPGGPRELSYEVNQQSARYSHIGPTLIRGVRVIDGLGNPPEVDRDLLLVGGRIKKIAKGGSIVAPGNALVLEGAGLTVLPGLMDLHTHFMARDRFAGDKSAEIRTYSDVYRYKSYLYAYLYSGVTTILDAGTDPVVAVGLKQLVNDGYVLGPRFFWSGPILEGESAPTALDPIKIGVSRPEDIPQVVSWLKFMDVDFVKLYRSMPLPMVERLSSEAHRQGLRVWMDAWERTGTGYLAKYGRIDGWAHLNFWFDLSDDDVAELVKHDHFSVTTFYALNVFSARVYEEHPDYFESPLLTNTLAPEFLDGMKVGMMDPLADSRIAVHAAAIQNVQDLMGYPDDDPKKVMRRMTKIGGRNMKRLLNAGVLIASGTDGGQGESTLMELELMVKDAGISPLEAIKVATYNGAKVLQKEKEFGSIQEGLLGDLLVVEGDPSKEIRDLRNIRYVFKEGKLVDRASLERQWGY